MRTVQAGALTLDRCDTCRGLWFDTLEMDRVAKDRRAVAAVDSGGIGGTHASPKRPAEMHCPRDKGLLITMHALGQPHITYESCKVCGGAFLDAGELTDLNELTLRERLQRLFR
jgi:Zn-finger nucleic acid-binding protein